MYGLALVATCGLVVALIAMRPGGGYAADSSPSTDRAFVDWKVLGQAQGAADRRQKWLASPEAASARRASRSRGRELGRAAALRQGREAFPVLAAKAWKSLDVPAGQKVEEFLSETTAKVRDARGKTSVMESVVPLRARDEGGELAPVDLTLVEGTTGLEPENPVVDITLPERSSGTVRLDGTGVGVDLGSATDVAGVADEDRMTYPNAWTDTDAVVGAKPGGFEMSFVLRSPASPESFALGSRLPAGATVEEADGGLRIIGADGKRIAVVSRPVAYDAQGTVVPTDAAVRGDEMVFGVEHRGKPLAYPILLDPNYTHDQYLQDYSGSQTKYGSWWQHAPTRPFWFNTSNQNIMSVQGAQAGAFYYTNDFGVWVYNPPAGSFVWQVQTRLLNHNPWNNANGPANWFVQGIYSNTLGRFESGRTTGINNLLINGAEAGAYEAYPLYNDLRLNWTPSGHDNNHVIIGLHMGTNEYRDGRMWANWGGLMTWLGELNKPAVTFNNTSTAWRKATSIGVTATDVGLGVNTIRLTDNGTALANQAACVAAQDGSPNDNRGQRCSTGPTTRTFNLADGQHDLVGSAIDIVDNVSPNKTQTARLDNGAPSLTASGPLWDARVGGTGDQTLHNEQYTLNTNATDGVASPSNNAQRRSGVQSIQWHILKADKTGTVSGCEAGSVAAADFDLIKDSGANPNTGDNASLSGTMDFRPDQYAAGKRLIKITATDRAGNVGRRCFEVDIVREPRAGRLGYYAMTDMDLTDRLRLSVNNANGNVLAQNTDFSLKGVGMDVVVGRSYNTWNKDVAGEFGRGWQLNMGQSVRLEESGNDVLLHGPTGYRVKYVGQSGGGFNRPFGVAARLTQPDGPDGRYELRWFRKGVRWLFTAAGTLDRIVDQNDNMIDLSYDSNGRVTKIEGGLVNGSAAVRRSRVVNIAYNSAGRVSSMSEPHLNRTYLYTYDAAGMLDTVTDPANAVVNYDYNTDGRLTKVTDGRTKATDIGYETGAPAYARAVSVTRAADAAGVRPAYGFRWNEATTNPSEGEANIVRMPRHTASFNADWRYVTNEADRVEHVRAPDPNPNSSTENGQRMSRTFDPAGNVNSFTSGETTNFEYSAGGENLETTTRGGLESGLTYGDPGAPNYPTQSTDSRGNTTDYGYNSTVGRQDLVSIQNSSTGMTAAETARIELPRNDDGTIDRVIRDQGAERVTTQYRYTAERELQEIEYLPGNGETTAPLKDETFSYDAASRMDVHTDGRGKTANYDYDAMDRVSKVTFTSGDYVSYGYDANGNLTSVTDRRGGSTYVTTTYTIDNLNRLTAEARGGSTVQSYGYDLNGNLRTHTEGTRTTTYDFDNRDLMASVVDADGNLTCFQHGREHRRLTSIRIEPTSCTALSSARVLIDRDYDADGRLQTLRAVDSTGARIERFEYTYQDDGGTGRVGALREYVRDRHRDRCIDWDYDTLGRLVDARVTASADDCDFDGNGSAAQVDRWQYEYDNASNLVEKTHNGTTTTYRVNSRDQLCWEASGTPAGNCSSVPNGGVDYDYDDAGNMVNASGRYQLAYDERSRTSTVTPNGKPAQTQTYAGEGQNERLTSGGTSFLHHQLGIGWANVTTVGTGDALAAGKTYFTRAPDGSLLSQRKPDGTTEYFILDAHPGSVVALVNADQTVAGGMVTARYRYDPYGNVVLKTGASDTPWRYAGAWFDRFPSSTSADQVGLYKMGERYYDPRTGRWTQRDALNQKSDLRESNRYLYAAANPNNRSDASGMASLSIEGDIGIPGTVASIGLGVEVDTDWDVSVSVGGGGGGGGSVGVYYAPWGDAADGGGISGSGCAGPTLIGPAACFGASNEGGRVGVGMGTQASIQYEREFQVAG